MSNQDQALAQAANEFFVPAEEGQPTLLACAQYLVALGNLSSNDIVHDVDGVDLCEQHAGRRAGDIANDLIDRQLEIQAAIDAEAQVTPKGWTRREGFQVHVHVDILPPTTTRGKRVRLRVGSQSIIIGWGEAEAHATILGVVDNRPNDGSEVLAGAAIWFYSLLDHADNLGNLACLVEKQWRLVRTGSDSRPSGLIHHYIVTLT